MGLDALIVRITFCMMNTDRVPGTRSYWEIYHLVYIFLHLSLGAI